MNEIQVSKEEATATTIGQEFAQRYQHSDHSLKDKIFSVSVGEYVPNPTHDKRFKLWPELFRHCRAWVEAHKEGPYVEYKTEADMMSYGMMRLGQVQKARVQPSWMACIRRLRELQKGAVTR